MNKTGRKTERRFWEEGDAEEVVKISLWFNYLRQP